MASTPAHPDDASTDPDRSGAGETTRATDTGAIVWSDRAADATTPPPAQPSSPDDGTRPPEPDATEPAPADNPGWRVGSVAGIPVYIGGGWVVIAIAMVFLFGPQIRSNLPDLGGAAYLVALVYALLLLFSVLVHEAAHAVVARRCGYRVHRVVADLMGGHTAYDATRATPGHSALVAVSGPLANLVLAVLGYLALPAANSDVVDLLIAAFAWTNGFVAIFNLLPGLPLDGGFLLDALVWKVTGKRHLGLLAAGWAGRLVTVFAVLWFVGRPLLAGARPSLFTVLWTALIGAFLWMGATRAIQTGRMRGKLAARDLADLVLPVVTVDGATPLQQLPGAQAVVVITDHGVPVGVLDPAAVEEAAQAGRLDAPARSCLRAMPPSWVYEVAPGTHDLGPVVDAMVERQVGALVLVDTAGRPHGILDGATVGAAL